MTIRPGAPRAGPATTIAAMLLLAVTAVGQLGAAHDKLVNKAEKAVLKAEAKIENLEAKEAAAEQGIVEAEEAWDETFDLLDFMEGLLAIAQADLEAALGLPEDTPEQQASKADAVSLAQKGVKLAQKEVSKLEKKLAKYEKTIEKLENKLDVLFDKLVDAEDALEDREEELAFLDQPFDFRWSTEVPLDLLVSADGLPLEDALVVITDTLGKPKGKKTIESLESSQVLWRGATGADGRVSAPIEVPITTTSLDVVVVAPGHDGPYTIPEHRERAGPFAPAARVSMDPAELDGAEVALSAWTSTPVFGGTGVLDDEVLAELGALLPAVPQPFAPFLDDDLAHQITLDEAGTVDVTFVWEDGDWRNTLGWFRYTEDPLDVQRSGILFDDASMESGDLVPGDSLTVSDPFGVPIVFEAGTTLGFFVLSNGAKSKALKAYDPFLTLWPYEDPGSNAEFGEGLVGTLPALNPEQAERRPELAHHTAMLRLDDLPAGSTSVLVGFESGLRTCAANDSDFNDLVILVTPQSMETEGFFDGSVGDPDGDGVGGTLDAYPEDALRAQVRRVPASGYGLTLLDDPYPTQGDLDFNDAVLAWAFYLVTDPAGDVVGLDGEFHLLARGNGADHLLVLHMPGLPADADGLFDVELFLSNDAMTHVVDLANRVDDMVLSDGKRIYALHPSTAAALPKLADQSPVMINTEAAAVNRPAASSRLRMAFDEPMPRATLGHPPYDLHWIVNTAMGLGDVHVAGQPALAPRPVELPAETGPEAFHDDEGWPWLMHLPFQLQRFPLEGDGLTKAFPKLLKWAASNGQDQPDWAAKVKSPAISLSPSSYFVMRDWQVELPGP